MASARMRAQQLFRVASIILSEVGVRKFELFRTFILDHSFHLFFLISIKRATTADFSLPFLRPNAFNTFPFVGFTPLAGRSVADTQQRYDFLIRFICFSKPNCLVSELGLHLRLQCSGVYFFHIVLIAYLNQNFYMFLLG